jgi:hypothetical protein
VDVGPNPAGATPTLPLHEFEQSDDFGCVLGPRHHTDDPAVLDVQLVEEGGPGRLAAADQLHEWARTIRKRPPLREAPGD